jgi:Flp pilus assembly protein TadD
MTGIFFYYWSGILKLVNPWTLSRKLVSKQTLNQFAKMWYQQDMFRSFPYTMQLPGRLVLICLNCILITSCATVSTGVGEAIDPLQLQTIMGEPSNLAQPTDVLELNDELRAYVDSYVDRDWSSTRKLERLREMIFSAAMLDLKYDTTRTRTAIETFEARRGNCLSMTNLYIAMARYAELDARYHIVPALPWWDQSDNTMIWNEHINAIGELRSDRQYVLDFIPEPPTTNQKKDKTVTDGYAQALYHNNLGAEALVNSQLDEALTQFRIALSIQPDLADAWNNMGIAQRRLGRDDLVEASLVNAIRLDPRHYTAMTNLEGHYTRQNNSQLAEYYRKKIRYHRSTNPFYQYALGSKALEQGDYKLAIRKLKKAIRQANNEPEFYHLLHVAYELSGNPKKSQKNLELARQYRNQQQQDQRRSTIRVISDPNADRFSIAPTISLTPR